MDDFLAAAPRGKRQRDKTTLDFSDDEDEDDGAKTAPKSSTDAIVERELKAEYAKKKAKADELRKGVKKKTVSFDEEMGEGKEKEEEDGAIMEDKVADARTVRQAAMRLNKAGGKPVGLEATDVVNTDVAEAEERERAPTDGEELFEAFNLDAERQDGFFDKDGNYVEFKKDEDPDDKWLEGVTVDEGLAERTKKLAEEANKPVKPLTDKEEAQIKRDIAAFLQPGETVLKGLKRLGGNKGAPGQKGAGRGGKQQGRGQKQGHQVDPEHREAFEKLTELSSLLMSHGEYEVYTFTKEAFEKSAKMLEPKAGSIFDRPAPAIGGAAAAKGGGSMFDDDDDMFAEGEKAAPKAAPAAAGAAAARGGAAPGSAGAAAPPESPPLDFAGWSISQLKQFLQRRGVSAEGAVEKGDLVSRAKGAAEAAGLAIPAGYAFDSQSGYYFGASSGLYFDLATGAFLNTSDQSWYLWDSAKNSFVKWEQTAS